MKEEMTELDARAYKHYPADNQGRERAIYCIGAIDQSKIDTDKVCDLMVTALNEGLLETSDIGKLNMWLRKAMEE